MEEALDWSASYNSVATVERVQKCPNGLSIDGDFKISVTTIAHLGWVAARSGGFANRTGW
jgi:hypothetical protein